MQVNVIKRYDLGEDELCVERYEDGTFAITGSLRAEGEESPTAFAIQGLESLILAMAAEGALPSDRAVQTAVDAIINHLGE